jgi:hypothetical protein
MNRSVNVQCGPSPADHQPTKASRAPFYTPTRARANAYKHIKKRMQAQDMLGAPQTHESDSSDRPQLEDTTNPTIHGDWRLYVQN